MSAASRRETRDVLTGIAVTAVVVAVLAVVFSPGRLVDETYTVTATFGRADGLRVGAPVRAAGVPVGDVASLALDERFRVRTQLRIDRSVPLDTDATAAIVTDGMFGEKLVRIDIGGGAEPIPDGGEIAYTEDSVVLDDLLELILRRARANSGQADRAPGESEGEGP